MWHRCSTSAPAICPSPPNSQTNMRRRSISVVRRSRFTASIGCTPSRSSAVRCIRNGTVSTRFAPGRTCRFNSSGTRTCARLNGSTKQASLRPDMPSRHAGLLPHPPSPMNRHVCRRRSSGRNCNGRKACFGKLSTPASRLSKCSMGIVRYSSRRGNSRSAALSCSWISSPGADNSASLARSTIRCSGNCWRSSSRKLDTGLRISRLHRKLFRQFSMKSIGGYPLFPSAHLLISLIAGRCADSFLVCSRQRLRKRIRTASSQFIFAVARSSRTCLPAAPPDASAKWWKKLLPGWSRSSRSGNSVSRPHRLFKVRFIAPRGKPLND